MPPAPPRLMSRRLLIRPGSLFKQELLRRAMSQRSRIRKRVKKDGIPSQQQGESKQITENKKPKLDNVNCRLLDLPGPILYGVLSRLPLEKILQCRSVCKTFFNILTDPYFSKVHLSIAPETTPSLIIQQNLDLSMCMLDLDSDLTSPGTSSSINARTSTSGPCLDHGTSPHPSLTQRNVKFCSVATSNMATVGSCNGLLCFNDTLSQQTLYFVSNPVLGEYTVLPPPIPSTPNYTYLGHSGFGFSPKSKQYKVIRFMSKKSLEDNMDSTWTPMADIHTLGTQSWRSIGGARVPKFNGSFDACLDGTLHWITDTRTPSDLICSFDLHTEQFHAIPPPVHFKPDYINKISGIKIGSIRGCLCVTYVSEDVQFTVWVMKDYGVKESWTKHFSIDVHYYVGLHVMDFDRPIKFSHSGELWFLWKSDSLVSYCPEKTSFKELSTLGTRWRIRNIAYVPSLLSLKNAVVDHNLEVIKCNQNPHHGSFSTLFDVREHFRASS